MVSTRGGTTTTPTQRSNNKENDNPIQQETTPPPRQPSVPLSSPEQDIPWSPTPSRHVSEEPIEVPTRNPKCGGRGGAWLAWEDRALAQEVFNIRPWTDEHGTMDQAWAKVASNAKKNNPRFSRGGGPCKERFRKILQWHEVSGDSSLMSALRLTRSRPNRLLRIRRLGQMSLWMSMSK